MSRVWGRHAPTRSLRKCRRIEEVKSRMDRKFSRIENLWPRDGSCPLPLRSKRIFNKCFRIVKAQKISRGGSAHVMGHRLLRTKFLPLFCSGVFRLAHGKRKVMAQYLVQTAYVRFKVQLPKRKIPPCKTGEKFCRVKRRQNKSGVLRGGKNLHGE